jgi:F-type H+-transporting ATPase subunit gamma
MKSQRELRAKIQSVKNITQITKAMEMVAAAKMKKAEKAVLATRPFAKYLFGIMDKLIKQGGDSKINLSLFKKNKKGSNSICFLVICSDRGLAGSFNNVILRFSMQEIEKVIKEGKIVEVVAVGKKAKDFFSAKKIKVSAEFFRYSDAVTIYDVAPVADWVLTEFEKGRFEKVMVCYSEFISPLVSRPTCFQLLPLEELELTKMKEQIIIKKDLNYLSEEKTVHYYPDYIFEPSIRELLAELSRYVIRVAITRFLFESNASEHSSRMITMKNATENAARIKDDLTLELNKARQSAITQEILEISSAKEALNYE